MFNYCATVVSRFLGISMLVFGLGSILLTQTGCGENAQQLPAEAITKVLPQAQKTAVVIDFTSATCGACQQLAPYLDGMRANYAQTIMFIAVDVPQAHNAPSGSLGNRLVAAFRPRVTPTLVAIKQGGVITSIKSGSDFTDIRDIQALFESALPPSITSRK
jgi:thioredoxin-like negative regulator of GroEL